ncbi:hypothetical protein BDW59DRAFT_136702 [Aspergillus cavernicola]|uniref:Uncharacterized protein n=1 Tax=Aspergillus cavernicola TaxID=176166 RepID=A0ABR4J473_9EURO
MKRQLLETTDWGAVRAARPVQVSFTPQEDLERFGKRRRLTKNDHERLNISKMPRLSLREEIPSEGDIPKNLEIRINGHRLGQHDTGINEETPLDIVSSQSMLLDDESLDSNHRFDIRVSLPSNSATRSASKLSMLSNGSQLCYISDVPDKTNSASDARGNPMHNQDTSEWMDWISDEHMLQGLQSNESSSIIPHAESPVRRRFTIDEQAIADREGRFKFPSPGAEPWITQFLHEGSYGACVRSPIKPSSQMGARIALGQCDNMAGPPSSNFPHFSWLPWPYPDGQRAGNNEYGAGTSMPPIQDYTNLSRSSVSGEQVIPLTIYGQPVVFQSIDMEIDVDQANASFAPSCRSQTREAQIPFRYTGSLSG